MKPRVVLLSAFLTPMRSGAEACAEEVAMELHDQFDITILTARMRRELPKNDTLRGVVPVVRLGFGMYVDKWLFPFLAPFAARKLQPSLVHAVLESFAGLALVFLSYISRVPTVLTCQSTNTSLFLCWMHRRAKRVTAISSVLIKRAVQYGRSDAVLIPNGLRLADVPVRKKISGRILFAGRLEKMKGIDTLLAAFEQLNHEAYLRIVGAGSLRSDLEKRAKALGIERRIAFAGYKPVPEVYNEFAEAEIFCGLSRSEAFGNVFVEAQAAGCAVIGTATGGIPDIIDDGNTGLLVAPDDAVAAAHAIDVLLSDTSFRQKISEAGQRNAQQYDWSHIARQYAQVYKSEITA